MLAERPAAWVFTGFARPRFYVVFEIGTENILIHPKHEAAAVVAGGGVVIKAADEDVSGFAVNASIFVCWHLVSSLDTGAYKAQRAS
jgi:hypothetical protein